MPITQEQALQALRSVQDPELFRDIVSLGMVKRLDVAGGEVVVGVELTTPACPMKDEIKDRVTRALTAAGATRVHVELSADTRGARGAAAPGQEAAGALPQVRNIIAVGRKPDSLTEKTGTSTGSPPAS